MGSTDTRILIQGRLHIPKTASIFSMLEDELNNVFVSTGHYHYFRVLSVDPSDASLLDAYDWLNNSKKERRFPQNSSEYEMYLFADVTEGEPTPGCQSKNKLNNFWQSPKKHLCISFIHLNSKNEILPAIKALEKFLKRSKMFEKCVYYVSFDYCDIVVFCQDTNFASYLNAMFKYYYANINGEKAPICKDIFSFYSFGAAYMKSTFEEFEKVKQANLTDPNISLGAACMKNKIDEIDKEEPTNITRPKNFPARFCLGLYSAGSEGILKSALDMVQIKYQCFLLYGRYDIMFSLRKCTLGSMLYMLYLIDNMTSSDEFGIITFESYVGAVGKLAKNHNSGGSCVELYTSMTQQFDSFFAKSADSDDFNDPRLMEIANSMLGIQKSGMGEDFTLCVLEPFIMFMKLIPGICQKRLADSQNAYSRALSALTNCMMHSEREFIQTTGFNAMFFYAPSKIMAFYASLVRLMLDAASGPRDAKYAFQLVPACADKIVVSELACRERDACNSCAIKNDCIKKRGESDKPIDKLLAIYIDEESLFNVNKVVYILAHEIAHFVGDKMRCRDKRRERVKKCFWAIAASEFLEPPNRPYDGEFDQLVDDLYPTSSDENAYSSKLRENVEKVVDAIQSPVAMRSIAEYFAKGITERLVNTEKYAGGAFWGEMFEHDLPGYRHAMSYYAIERRQRIAVGSADNYGTRTKQYCNLALEAFKEAYADLNMLLLLNMSFSEYIQTFTKNENAELDDVLHEFESRLRIFCVAKVMFDKGKWIRDENCADKDERDAYEQIDKYFKNERPRQRFYDPYVAKLLYEYLSECYVEICSGYKENESAVEKIRKFCKGVNENKKILEIYNNMEEAISAYRECLENEFLKKTMP